jgi:hypothetical protein
MDVPELVLSNAADARISCIRPEDCMLAQPDGHTMVLYALDLTTGRTKRRFVCPEDGNCDGRRRWTYAPGGDVLLFIAESQRELFEVDARTGSVLRTHPDPPDGVIIQSVRVSADHASYWLTAMNLGIPDRPMYALYEYQPGQPFRMVWGGDSPWLSGAEPSPDGTQLATDALTFHVEGWLANIEGLCAGVE